MYNSVSQALFTQLDFKNVPPPPQSVLSKLKFKIKNIHKEALAPTLGITDIRHYKAYCKSSH